MAYNSAVICPTKECLPPSCYSCDSASVDIVFITQSSNMATRMCETANDLRQAVTLFCKDCITGVIHPKVKLYI